MANLKTRKNRERIERRRDEARNLLLYYKRYTFADKDQPFVDKEIQRLESFLDSYGTPNTYK